MKLEILVNGRLQSLEFDPAAADIREVEPGIFSVLIDGRSFEVRLDAGPRGYYADINGLRYEIQVRDPRRLLRDRGVVTAAGRQKIASPMPGKIVRVMVREGDEVVAGQDLLVVEAMKMQNEIRSPKAGRVIVLRAAVGNAVASGETLAEVE